MPLGSRQQECGLIHPQHIKDVFGHIFVEFNSGNDFDHGGKHIVAKAVLPLGPRFKTQGFLRQSPDHFAGGATPFCSIVNTQDRGGMKIVIESCRHGEKVADRDFVFGIRNAAFRSPHFHPGILRQIAAEFIIKLKLSLLPELERRTAGYQFGTGKDLISFLPCQGGLFCHVGKSCRMAVDHLSLTADDTIVSGNGTLPQLIQKLFQFFKHLSVTPQIKYYSG